MLKGGKILENTKFESITSKMNANICMYFSLASILKRLQQMLFYFSRQYFKFKKT